MKIARQSYSILPSCDFRYFVANLTVEIFEVAKNRQYLDPF